MIEYIFIAILQGLLEWLPISSSGQVMIIAINLLGIPPEQAFSIAIWLHLGTTISVIIKFKSDVIKIVKSIIPNRIDYKEIDIKRRNWLVFSTIGTIITAIPFYFFFKYIIGEGFGALQGDIITLIISGLLIVTGIVLLRVHRIFGTKDFSSITGNELRYDSFLAGLMQGLSILPGISRSGMTISTILLENHNKETALKLSFLMSIPAALGSIGFDIIFGEGSVFGILDPLTIVIITVISFLAGYISIDLLLKLAKKIQFGYFCIIYGLISFAIIIPVIIITLNSI